MEYQNNYTDSLTARTNMYDQSAREMKAGKVVAVLHDHRGPTWNLRALEVACSAGYMTKLFAGHFKSVTAIDIDAPAVEFASQNNASENCRYLVMDALAMTFPDSSFDVVICSQMYEHTPSPERLMAEIYRVLAPGGTCYFGATNRLKVIETHYGKIPFLSYFPKRLAHNYLKLLGRGEYYYETLYTYWGLRKLTRSFSVIDYTLRVIRDPKKFCATDVIKPGSIIQILILFIAEPLYPLMPGYVWLLQKPE
jgi:ubiquinone/menaquinone biosynthesis C-methylase UbiE